MFWKNLTSSLLSLSILLVNNEWNLVSGRATVAERQCHPSEQDCMARLGLLQQGAGFDLIVPHCLLKTDRRKSDQHQGHHDNWI